MKRVWLILASLIIVPMAAAQYAVSNPNPFRGLPNHGGVWKASSEMKLVSDGSSTSSLATNDTMPPAPAPGPSVKMGDPIFVDGETYEIPTSRPANSDMEIYVNGIMAARQTGAHTTGNYIGNEKDLEGKFRVTGAGMSHEIFIRLLMDGFEWQQSRTLELPRFPIPEVALITLEGDLFNLNPKWSFTGAHEEHLLIRESFFVAGDYTDAVEGWDPFDPNYKAPRASSGRPMAWKESVHLRQGTIAADHSVYAGRNNGKVLKLFLKHKNGGYSTHKATFVRTKPSEVAAQAEPVPVAIEFKAVSETLTEIKVTIQTKGALSGMYFGYIEGQRRASCPWGPWGWLAFWDNPWGMIPGHRGEKGVGIDRTGDKSEYSTSFFYYVPKEFALVATFTVDLQIAPGKWQTFYAAGQMNGENVSMCGDGNGKS